MGHPLSRMGVTMTTDAEPTPEPQDEPTPDPQDEPHGTPPDDASKETPQGEPKSDDQGPDVEKIKADARKSDSRAKRDREAREKAEAERDESRSVLEKLRKALDPDGDKADEKPEDAAQRLTSERDQTAAELKAERLERRAEKEARAQGLDPDALLDSRGFVTALGKLDPTADDFGEQLSAAVEKAGEANPRLKAEASASSGNGQNGAPATTGPTGGGEEKATTTGGSKTAVEEQLEARRKSRQA